MRVKAAVARAHGVPLALADLELDEPRAGEVLVRMIASGVAACDLAAIAGELAMPVPFVPGCEGAGIVERVGEGVTVPSAGDAVLIVPARQSRGRALAGVRVDGSTPFDGDGGGAVNGFFFGQSSFATHLLCPAVLAVPVADGAPLELLAGLGREVLLGAGLVLQQPGLEGATVVITGADAAGLGACMAAAAAGAGTIVVADPRESRRELALTVGAMVAVPADDGLGAVVKSLVAGGAGHAFETSGAPAAQAGCEASLGVHGRCVAVNEDAIAQLDAGALIPRLLAMHAEGRFPLEKLVAYYPFELVNDALAALASGEVAKPVLRFSLGSFGDLDRALQEGAAQEEPRDDAGSEDDGSEPADAPTEGEREAPPVTA